MEGAVDKEIQKLVLSYLPVVKKCAFGNECNGNGFLGENNFSAFPVLPVEKENISCDKCAVKVVGRRERYIDEWEREYEENKKRGNCAYCGGNSFSVSFSHDKETGKLKTLSKYGECCSMFCSYKCNDQWSKVLSHQFDETPEYGSLEMDTLLVILSRKSKLKPIPDLFEFSKKVFVDKFYKGDDGPINPGMTIGMAIQEDATWEQGLAGWYLTLRIIQQKRDELGDNIPKDKQNEFVNVCRDTVMKRFPEAWYYITEYFHKSPSAPWNRSKTSS
tara:strand:- start:966 stop:1790 length:825 start_codon:yes stop_codon:yes gene_type:complete